MYFLLACCCCCRCCLHLHLCHAPQNGSPKVYVSHGIYDDVLNIDYCSRRLVPRLKHMLPKAELHYVEFNGSHVVRADISKEALDWFLEGASIEESSYSQAGQA